MTIHLAKNNNTMKHLKYFKEHFIEDNPRPGENDEMGGYKIPPSIETREEQIRFAKMAEQLFNGLGLDINITVKDVSGCFFKWIEVSIFMCLTEIPFSLLSLLLNYLNPSYRWMEQDYSYFKLKTNKNIYGKIKDGKELIRSFKLVFSKARSIDMLKIDDKKTWFLFNPSTPEEALKITIREFLKLINSCSDTIYSGSSSPTKLFGVDGQKSVKGIRHFINGYLKGGLTNYDRKNIINHINKSSGDINFYKAMEFQKKINPDIFKLLNIPDEHMRKGSKMDDMGFMD